MGEYDKVCNIMKDTARKQMLLGGLLLGAGALYLYCTKDDEENMFEGLEGLKIDLKPDELIDSAVTRYISDERLGRGAKHLAKKLSYKLLG
jgi:hypothetical protein